MRKIFLLLSSAIPIIGSACWALTQNDYQHVVVSGYKYTVPKIYRSISGERAMGFSLSLSDFTPSQTMFGGWNNKVLILITEFGTENAADLWNRLYGENRRFSGKDHEFIERRVVSNHMVEYKTGSGRLVYVPDQDMHSMPYGFIECKTPTEIFIDPSCEHFYTINGQRRKITYGVKNLWNYSEIRQRVDAFISSFEVK